ncbi:hypothetical protein INN71_17490 [Nocardioides sp. ChNu-153]|uniref:hypothetical protein n=1 Tax=unclassified Nocardioides TaxID=2615069 RepID=UPI002406D63E|nr:MULTISPECIES: hypothetical protein [unclassified Nocardioides]MDF9716878.1 hypothetical protein [Nocardioides sp. ChNu-99]MDN7123178.1 hypothetical protein [Nocardioides sp. ChNu-153]
MRVVPPGTPTGDLFWDLLRRRHPTVDVVLRRPGVAGAAAGDVDLADERERVVLDVPRLLEAAGLGALLPDEPEVRLLAGGSPDAVRWHARVARTVEEPTATDAVERLASLLAGRGQEVRRTTGPALAVLHAGGPQGRCRASYAPGTQRWVLERWSPAVRVGRERARALRTEAARAVADGRPHPLP